MNEPDELFTLKSNLWIGNYQTAIQEGAMLSHLDGQMAVERDAYMNQAYIANKQYDMVIDSVTAQEASGEPVCPSASALRLLAMYLKGGGTETEVALLTINEWLLSPSASQDNHLLLVAGLIYGQEEKFSDAFSCLQRPQATLEHSALCVQLYLQMDRLELAEQQVSKMKKMEEDATLTHLAMAWVYEAQGGSKCDESALLFQELGERFGSTPTLLNGSAVSYMMMLNFEEGERLLLESVTKEQKDANTFINLVSVSRNLCKPQDEVDQYLKQLRQVCPSHPWLENLSFVDAEFDRVADTFK